MSLGNKKADADALRPRPHAALATLSLIAGVPPSNRSKFEQQLQSALDGTFVLGRHWRVGTPGDIAQIDRLVRAARDYGRAVIALGPSAQALVGSQVFEIAATVSRHAQRSETRVRRLTLSSPSKRGRPLTRVRQIGQWPPGFTSFDAFVWSTFTYVHAAGGRLTLDKNRKQGSLVAFLDLLRSINLIPEDFVPRVLPIARLHRLKADWTKKGGPD